MSGGHVRGASGRRLSWALSLALCAACSPPGEPPRDPLLSVAEARLTARDLKGAAEAFARLAVEGTPSLRPHALAQEGLARRKLGEYARAEAALTEAIAQAEAAGDGRQAAVARRFLASAYTEQGQQEGARALLERAAAWHRENGPVEDLLRTLLSSASLSWQERDLVRASRLYAEVAFRATVDPRVCRTDLPGKGLEGRGMLLGHAGALAEARALLGQATAIYDAAGLEEAAISVRVNEAVLASLDGDWASAADLARLARSGAQRLNRPLILAHAGVALAGALVRLGQVAEAELEAEAAEKVANVLSLHGPAFLAATVRLEAAITLGEEERAAAMAEALVSRAKTPDEVAQLAGLSGRAALARGDLDVATRHLERAVATWEQVRAQLATEGRWGFFVPERLWAYEALLGLRADARDAAAVSALSDRVKARDFVERLVMGARRRRGEEADLAAKLQRLPTRPEPTLDVEAWRVTLPPDLLVLDYYLLPDRLLVSAISAQGVSLTTHWQGSEEVSRQVRALMEAVRSRRDDWTVAAAVLTGTVLAPVADTLLAQPAGSRLVVVPHGPLHEVPFALLPLPTSVSADGHVATSQALMDRVAVFSAPSLSALATALDGRPAGPPRSVMVVGDPRGDLPAARREVETVASRFPVATVLAGADATEARVRAEMGTADVLHFAVHGRKAIGADSSWLELQPGGGHDGRLMAEEVAASRLSARLAVLLVCDSASGRAVGGDEVPGVLDRAFLAGGARAVIATRWPVDDRVALRFAERFYAELAVRPALDAFHRAQLALRNESAGGASGSTRGVREVKGAAVSSAHPSYWAAFTFRGDPR